MEENLISVVRHEEFEAAHLLKDYDGQCRNLHGHTYKIEVKINGPQDKGWGMVVDFSKLKKIIKDVLPDHRFMAYSEDDISMEIVKILDKYDLDYVIFPFDPTAENMVSYFAEIIQLKLEEEYDNCYVEEVKLWETTNSYAEWRIHR